MAKKIPKTSSWRSSPSASAACAAQRENKPSRSILSVELLFVVCRAICSIGPWPEKSRRRALGVLSPLPVLPAAVGVFPILGPSGVIIVYSAVPVARHVAVPERRLDLWPSHPALALPHTTQKGVSLHSRSIEHRLCLDRFIVRINRSTCCSSREAP